MKHPAPPFITRGSLHEVSHHSPKGEVSPSTVVRSRPFIDWLGYMFGYTPLGVPDRLTRRRACLACCSRRVWACRGLRLAVIGVLVPQ
jgi:hypothetical protein